MGYACLPVHDSFIVHHGLEDELNDMMLEAFRAKFGVKSYAGVSRGKGLAVSNDGITVEKAVEELLSKPHGYDIRLEAFRAMNVKAS